MAFKRNRNISNHSQRSKSQPLIEQFLKKSKQNKKISANNTTKISLTPSPYKNLTECPMCCKKLNGLNDAHRDVHINMCLDLAFNAPTVDISNNNNNNNKNVIIPKYIKNPLKRSYSHSSMNSNNYSNRKKNKLNRYYTTMMNNGFNSNHAIKPKPTKQGQQEHYNKYKRLDNSNIIIDGFKGHTSFGGNDAIYFLTHFHSDHYGGLTKTFRNKLIYCSEITSRLIYSQIGIISDVLRPLPMFTRCLIENSNPKTFVTLLDANHCPGAVMFLFEMHCNDNNNNNNNDIKYHLHIGDARCEFESNSLFYLNNYHILSTYYGKIDKLYLDTTYCPSKIDLPRQSDAIQFIVNKCKMYLNDYNQDLVILIGTYSIGKERILKEIAKQCNKQIFITDNKQNIFNAVYADNTCNIFTNDDTKTNIHVVGMSEVGFGTMWKYKKKGANTKVIGIRPSGWAKQSSSGYKHRKREKKHIITPIYSDKTSIHSMIIYEIPYSEHSSFMELCKFVKDINPKEIIPTTNNRTREAVTEQIELLNEHKDKFEYEYQELCEDNGLKQVTLENYYDFPQTNLTNQDSL